MKVVAIQRGLDHIKNQLQALGYRTVYLDETNFPIDALIYLEERNDNTLLNINNFLVQQLSNQSVNYDYTGVILINAKNKSMDEIVHIIEKRYYSPLF